LDIIHCLKYTEFREQADWTLILLSAAFWEIAGPLAEKNGAALSELLLCIINQI
jgi:hypothetical protein